MAPPHALLLFNPSEDTRSARAWAWRPRRPRPPRCRTSSASDKAPAPRTRGWRAADTRGGERAPFALGVRARVVQALLHERRVASHLQLFRRREIPHVGLDPRLVPKRALAAGTLRFIRLKSASVTRFPHQSRSRCCCAVMVVFVLVVVVIIMVIMVVVVCGCCGCCGQSAAVVAFISFFLLHVHVQQQQRPPVRASADV
jgi:hypothetical protein